MPFEDVTMDVDVRIICEILNARFIIAVSFFISLSGTLSNINLYL